MLKIVDKTGEIIAVIKDDDSAPEIVKEIKKKEEEKGESKDDTVD